MRLFILLTIELEFVELNSCFSILDTGIIPANVPVTKASSQSLISSKVKFFSLQGIYSYDT